MTSLPPGQAARPRAETWETAAEIPPKKPKTSQLLARPSTAPEVHDDLEQVGSEELLQVLLTHGHDAQQATVAPVLGAHHGKA